MKNISAELEERKIRPMIFGSWASALDEEENEPIVFQRNTHYNLETNLFNYSYDFLPFEGVTNK